MRFLSLALILFMKRLSSSFFEGQNLHVSYFFGNFANASRKSLEN